jgi:hypothetical protein
VQRWEDTWGALLNAHRAAAGLDRISDVRSHMFTDRPWLAADPTLGPWPEPEDRRPALLGATRDHLGIGTAHQAWLTAFCVLARAGLRETYRVSASWCMLFR